MRNLGTLIIVGAFSLLASFNIASAQTPNNTVRLCTGASDGVYYAAGKEIASSAPRGLTITLVETTGTLDNLDRTLKSNECDAMIGQPDGPVYMKRMAPASVSDLKIAGDLHREYLHVLCNAASGITDLGNLPSNPKAILAIGEQGSGGWLIWQNIMAEDAGYSKVKTTELGGTEALSAVAAGKEATCMLVPAGIKNGTVNKANDLLNSKIKLVGADDKDFNDAVDLEGEPLYSYDFDIVGSKSVYPKLLGGTFSYSTVETISWNAGVYMNTKRLDKATRVGFLEAIMKATPRIVGAYGG